MKQDRRPAPVSPERTNLVLGWLEDVVRQARLAWRLLWDKRVPAWTKLIPPVALAYVIFPIDIIPDVALGLGQLDDIAIVLLGAKLFIELAPPEIVREHLRALGARIQEWQVVDEDGDDVPRSPVVVEGEFDVVEGEATELEAEPPER